MPRAHNERTRARVHLLIDAGYSDSEITTHIRVAERTIRRYRQNLRLFGQLNRPNGGGGRPRQLSSQIEDALFEFLTESPDVYYSEMLWFIFDEFGVVTTERTVRRVLRKRQWSRKVMRQVAKQRSQYLREDWIARIKDYHRDQFVFVDESACNQRSMDRKYGWSPVNTPAIGIQALKREKRLESTAGIYY